MRKPVLSASIDFVTSYYTFFLLSLLVANATGRYLLDSSSESVSDGVSGDVGQPRSSSLRLKGMEDSKEYYCSDQMYGFLPCSSTLPGHLFLVVVYEYLLFQGESLVVSGGAHLFEILGPGAFGASAFPVIGPLPESLILLTSGLLSSKEEAQEYVITGVGLLAGSTIFLLTLVWGTCVIVGSHNFPSSATQNEHKKSFLSWTGLGVTTDAEASHTAKIMLLSLLPFILILIPKIFSVSYTSEGYKIDILITLVVSVISLVAYLYKMSNEQIQRRRLEYVKVEHELLVLDIIHSVQEHISEPLLTKDGVINEDTLRRLFKKMDKNDDNHISYLELKELLEEIKLNKLTWNWKNVMTKLINEFDRNGDKKITYAEFKDVVTKWVDMTKGVLHEPNHPKLMWKFAEQQIIKEGKHKETMKHLTSELYGHGSQHGVPPTDEETLRKVFESIDEDKDSKVSLAELKKRFLGISLDEGDAAEKIMMDFDKNKNEEIDVEEFISGMKKWNHTCIDPDTTTQEHAKATHQRMIKEVDKSRSAKTKAIALLVLGIAILAILAEPLIHSVQKFSASARIPSFYVAFILVPLATNARTAILAIRAAREKNLTTASLTFSEIYDGVFMNNILGMSVVLSVIYIRGLTWHFSFEVLAALVVCLIMGLLASYRSNFPIWTSSIAYMLYVSSLILVYVLNDAFRSP